MEAAKMRIEKQGLASRCHHEEMAMRTPLRLGTMLLALLSVLAALPTRAADDDLPSFKKRGDNEKQFVTEVGIAIVKAARDGTTNHELDSYKIEDIKDKNDRKDLKITMKWVGGITKKKFLASIVVHIDTTNEKEWQVSSIDYEDDHRPFSSPNRGTPIQDLIKKFNR